MRPRARSSPLSSRRLPRVVGGMAGVLALALTVAPLAAQNTITGAVVDGSNQRPLVGAQVVIDGTELGGLTDNRGRFLILNAPAGTVTLRVLMIGYREATAQASADQAVTIELQETAISLDEIIVTGTVGEQQARSIGNAIGRVDAAVLQERAPVAEVQQLLSATVPGVRIMNTGGAIGEGGVTRIRGVASLTLVATPIVVVDGIRVNGADGDPSLLCGIGADCGDSGSRINDFDPDEIESIEVIKGPAAATLYGTEASNGVIQIITKRGARGAPRVNARIRQGASWMPNPVELVPPTYYKNSAGQIVEVNVLKHDKENTFGLLDCDPSTQTGCQPNGGHDWFRTGHNQSYGADVSGGTENVTYFVSGEFDRMEGPVPYNWQNTLRGRANLTYAPSDAFRFDFSLGANRSKMESASAQQPLLTAVIWSCPAPGCEPGSGTPQALDGPSRGYIAYLPEAYQDEIEGVVDIDRTTYSLQAHWEPREWLAQKMVLGGDFGTRTNTELYLATGNLGNFFNTGRKTVANERTSFITADYQASSDWSPFESISLSTGGGLQFYSKKTEILWARGESFPVKSLETIPSGSTRSADEEYLENKTFGVFLQEQVGFGDRLYLTAAVRGDDNSAFGRNFDFVVYPKFSGSYVISDEAFFAESVGFVEQLKLRAAWGQAGKQPDVFDALRTYEPSVGPGGSSTVTPENIGNADLKPEVGTEVEVGFDASLLNDRIGLEFTWYDQTTQDAIVSVPAIPSNGFPGVQFQNIGEVRNSGIEVGVNANVFSGETLSLDIGGTFSTTNNEISDLGGQPAVVHTSTFGQYHVEGQPLAGIYMKRIVSATLDGNSATNVMCEGGTILPSGEAVGASAGGGAPVPCADAPNVFWGQPIPDKEGSAYATVSVGSNLQLYALVDYVGGRTLISGDIAAQHRFFINSRAILERTQSLDDLGWPAGQLRGQADGSRSGEPDRRRDRRPYRLQSGGLASAQDCHDHVQTHILRERSKANDYADEERCAGGSVWPPGDRIASDGRM
ncbi:MAG: SusC/RagA family TonB-linked outer membrane protein [Gemmatimonadota bacterium]|nr:SusC/RagA family TonB-linked outer membrane protein [Gemmatimonadota bacterium]